MNGFGRINRKVPRATVQNVNNIESVGNKAPHDADDLACIFCCDTVLGMVRVIGGAA
jgi:glyceraldehyde-3-phosphate dehydrogenase/erythrose-4-phosphate dehydrogenase